MPKLTKAVPKYRKHRASGQAVVTLDGTDIYLGPHGTKVSRNEYDRVVSEYLANGRSLPRRSEARPITVVELAAKYWKHAKRYYVKNGEPTTELAAMKNVLRPLKRLYGSKPAIEFGPLSLKTIRQEWITSGNSRGVINSDVRRVCRVFRWGVAEELFPVEVYQSLKTVEGLKKGRTEAREIDPIVPVELSAVEATMKHLCDVVADMIRLQMLTGMRPMEVCSVRPADVTRAGDVWEFRPNSHKTEHHHRERVVFIGPEGQAVLAPYLLRPDDSYCFSPLEAVKQQRQLKRDARTTPQNYGSRPGYAKRWITTDVSASSTGN